MSQTLPPIRLRPLTTQDAEALQQVYNAAADYFLGILARKPNLGEASRDIQSAIIEPNRHILGVEYAGALIGLLDVRLHFPAENVAQIGLLLLSEKQRNQGLGTWALRMFESWLRRDTPIRMVRLNIAASNRDAQRFWQREGYRFNGEASRIDLATHSPRLLVMTKTLTEPPTQ